MWASRKTRPPWLSRPTPTPRKGRVSNPPIKSRVEGASALPEAEAQPQPQRQNCSPPPSPKPPIPEILSSPPACAKPLKHRINTGETIYPKTVFHYHLIRYN